MSEKIYKAGTTVWLWWCTHDPQSKEVEEYTLTEDMTEEELEKLAEDYMWNDKEPEWGFSETKPEQGRFD